MKIWAQLSWAVRWGMWWLRSPGYRLGDPSLGVGEQRHANVAILKARHAAREPTKP